MNNDKIDKLSEVLSLLSDSTRLKVIFILLENGIDEPLKGKIIAEKAEISIPLLCHHCKLLCNMNILNKKKSGQSKLYSINTEGEHIELLNFLFNKLD
ncbi:ArsR/SmtB family transcription factor [Vibrio lentus]|uniref:ArsR/SmtB family transcription factor n=1 Tax=Vibrio lentus TaxID=136468 RepID=UPI000C848907|nr:winged helix-turn-helix transcriptional regulator [Vibrio lentus]PMI80186.1 hypothetical protein BCU36_17065 [Vibrio lentus]